MSSQDETEDSQPEDDEPAEAESADQQTDEAEPDEEQTAEAGSDDDEAGGDEPTGAEEPGDRAPETPDDSGDDSEEDDTPPTDEERLEQLTERIEKARTQAEEAGVLTDDDAEEYVESGATEEEDDQTITPPGCRSGLQRQRLDHRFGRGDRPVEAVARSDDGDHERPVAVVDDVEAHPPALVQLDHPVPGPFGVELEQDDAPFCARARGVPVADLHVDARRAGAGHGG
jgi:hypothetical protein